jgi:RimJ/RimL family protein N-acetyltransferase
MKYIFQTERLRLREFTLNDAQFIIELLNSPGWLRFIGDRNVKTEQQAIDYLENGPLKSYRENGFGLSLVEKKSDNVAIGMCGILRRDNLDNPDLGFAFLPEFSGNGYAYEITLATLMYTMSTLKIPKVWAITVGDNEKSIGLLEKLGFSFLNTISSADGKSELRLYSTK